MDLNWKEQFSLMHGSLHVYPKMAALSPSHSLRAEAPYTKYFATITAALQSANEGDRIVVHPGVYNESLELDRPVELIGAGPEKVLLVNSALTVVEVKASAADATIANMEIKFDAPDDNPSLRQYCVQVPNGAHPSIHNCHFTNTSFCGACVYVHGASARPRVSHCTIANANNVGIFVDDHAHVSLLRFSHGIHIYIEYPKLY
jgi:F-box protein 11